MLHLMLLLCLAYLLLGIVKYIIFVWDGGIEEFISDCDLDASLVLEAMAASFGKDIAYLGVALLLLCMYTILWPKDFIES